MPIQNPVIVIPGITASDLMDDYPLKTETLWSMVFNKDYQRLALHPDDLRYEAIEPAHVFAGRAFEIYNDLIKALRHELSVRADRPTPVFGFGYDWRVDIRLTGHQLAVFVDEVIARTRLLKHYGKEKDEIQVDLVGHSMGGLIICEYLSQYGSKARVNKVATIGTPFLGAVEAVVKVTTGMSLLSGDIPSERERESARVTPAVYQLFPSFEGAVVDPQLRDVNLFDLVNIQRSVVESLTEFVRLYAVDTPAVDRRARAETILANMLAGAQAHRKTVMSFKPAEARLRQKDWLAIVGVGQKTRVQMTVEGNPENRRFVINDDQFVDELSTDEQRSRRTGDGTVPLPGAIPPFLPNSQLVCVMKSDLGFLELKDRAMTLVAGFHGLLPAVNLVQRLVVRHLRPDYRGPVWGRRLPGATTWGPPIDGLVEKAY